MIASKITQSYVWFIAVLSLACLVYVYAFPPTSMFSDRDGIAHFTPAVLHPETGVAIDLGDLIKHYRGD